MKIIFAERGWLEYLTLQSTDKQTLKKINTLIKDIARNGADSGLGKPDRLKGTHSWSRRIDQKNRLVYNLDADGNMIIISCLGHYEDK